MTNSDLAHTYQCELLTGMAKHKSAEVYSYYCIHVAAYNQTSN